MRKKRWHLLIKKKKNKNPLTIEQLEFMDKMMIGEWKRIANLFYKDKTIGVEWYKGIIIKEDEDVNIKQNSK